MNDISTFYALIFRDIDDKENLICRYNIQNETIRLMAPELLSKFGENPGELERNDLWFVEYSIDSNGKFDVGYTVDMEVDNGKNGSTAEFLADCVNDESIQKVAIDLLETSLLNIRKSRVMN